MESKCSFQMNIDDDNVNIEILDTAALQVRMMPPVSHLLRDVMHVEQQVLAIQSCLGVGVIGMAGVTCTTSEFNCATDSNTS